MIRTATPADATLLARLHALAFERPWSAMEFHQLLSTGAAGAIADEAGFILWRAAAGEAEILTLAVDPDQRRQGRGRRLVETALADPAVEALFLEVAADNAAAIALYRAAGFATAGLRKGYYSRPGQPAADALVLRRSA